MDMFVLNDTNYDKWIKLHKEFSDKKIRTKVNYAIMQIASQKDLINTEGAKSRTLEVGCGFGRNLSHLMETQFSDEYIGLDMSDIAIEKCSIHLSSYIEKGVLSLAKGNVGKKINYPDSYFDCVYDIMSAITFIIDEDERKKYFNEVSRVLKPGGVYFFLAVRKDGIFKDIIYDENLLEKGFVTRAFDSMLEKAYSYEELIGLLDGLELINLEVPSDPDPYIRAFGDEEFIRENAFWLGSFRKP